jgi:hypothetical protein
MNLHLIKNILLTVTEDVFHNESHKKSEYVVWREIGSIKLEGDNASAESGSMIAVDFFTKSEYSEIPARITKALESCDEIAVSDTNIGYEEDTKLTRYSWICEVI